MKAYPKTIGTSNVRIIRVTPEDAIELLSSNFAGQRKIKKTNVTRLAKSMSDGKWDPYLGDLIRMTRDGVLVDGQHRLEAVVQSEVTCDFLFSNDFDVSDFPYIDTGGEPQARRRARRRTLEKRRRRAVKGHPQLGRARACLEQVVHLPADQRRDRRVHGV